MAAAAQANVPATVIGATGGDRIRIAVAGDVVIDSPVIDAEQAWAMAIERKMRRG
jgi:hypothetical protein